MPLILLTFLLITFEADSQTRIINFSFFGLQQQIEGRYQFLDNESSFLKSIKSLVPRTIDEISEIHAQLESIAKRHNLDDYGRLILYLSFINGIPADSSSGLYSLPEVLQKNRINEPTGTVILSALLWRSGIENIILQNEKRTLLGIRLGGVTDMQGYFIDRGKKRFYLKDLSFLPAGELKNDIDLKRGFKIFDFNLKGRAVDLNFTQGLPLLPPGKVLKRNFGFVFNDKYYKFSVTLDSNITSYSDMLPNDYSVRVKSGILEMKRNGLADKITKIFKSENFTELEKVNFLLSMISQLFNYTESEIKGVSKNLIDLANDCDARSTFFASLLLSTLKMSPSDILFLEFPGAEHAVVGVNLKNTKEAEIEGTYIKYRGKKFWICDTTYLIDGLARLGALHPDYEGKEIIPREVR